MFIKDICTVISKTKFKFTGETANKNGHIFQTKDESKDPSQNVKPFEALKWCANKTYNLDLSFKFESPS